MNTLAIVLAVALYAIYAQAYDDSDFVHPHIVRGTDARVGEVPWQGSLQRFGRHLCGCVLISRGWVLTAAHCVAIQAGLKVVLGLHNQGDMSTGAPRTYGIKYIIVHDSWTGNIASTDAALIRLLPDAQLGNYVKTMFNWASEGDNFVGQSCVISGWGVTTEGGGSLSRTLQRANVPVIPLTQCRGTFSNVNNGHICVGGQGGSGACNGDSGGPLVCGGRLAGIRSFGVNGCSTRSPSVYTRVGHIRYWIGCMTEDDC